MTDYTNPYTTFDTAERKLIYIQTGNNADDLWPAYVGLEKIGDATAPDFEADLTENSPYLRAAAERRINQYMNTAGVPYILHWAELAYSKSRNSFFRDHAVHEVLKRSGYKRKELGKDEHGKPLEWFKVDIETAKRAIKAVKNGSYALEQTVGEGTTPYKIKFRPEQDQAITETSKVFKNKSKMLWNAKMRFGKTLSALQVVKDNHFMHTLIITHRPVVEDGWFEDFDKIFKPEDGYLLGSRDKREKLVNLAKQDKPFVYFASMQDLRGLKVFGGTHTTENKQVAEIDWDFIIVDEAHEGTRTEIAQNVLKVLQKENTKVLELTGTAFNILDDYDEDETFTWDYVMEQEAKQEFAENHPNAENPYDSLPKVSMYTFELQDKFHNEFLNTEDKAFNFMEFFRVDEAGKFVHEGKVNDFLNEITKPDPKTNYPFSTPEFRNSLRHTLWLLPRVDSCRALKALMEKHPVFGMDYKIINIVDENDDVEASDSDLARVKNAISEHPSETCTITLTVRKMTTGVTIKPWTGVMFLNNTSSASSYLQAAFRAQTPFSDEKLGMKKNAYIFDFAPDRALTLITSVSSVNSGVGKRNTPAQKEKMGEFLNFLPVIGNQGNGMKPYDVNALLTRLKKVYAEKAVRSGFEDDSLYNDELLKLDENAWKSLIDLKGIIGTSNNSQMPKKEVINDQGLTDEEYDDAEKLKNKSKRQLTDEQQELLDKVKEAKKQRKNAISILRGISIRIPMMIYGMSFDLDKDVDIDSFIKQVDDISWAEFMPAGVTKTKFKEFAKYYDPEVFIEAGHIIRRRAKSYDELEYTERAEKIAQLFSTFKNPDKETVLTPWRVVNLQLSKTIGGLRFFDKNFEIASNGEDIELEWVQTPISDEVFKINSKILDINSKTGLYPLYATASLLHKRRLELNEERAGKIDARDENRLVQEILKENIYVLAKTPMAKTITQRTLVGYQNWETNIQYIENLNAKLKDNLEQTTAEIQEKLGSMKFDVVIGNPPYQEESVGNSTSNSPIYNKFMDEAYKLADKVVLITPARFLFNAGATGNDWNQKMLNDEHLKVVYFEQDSSKVFPNTDIKGGVAVTYRDISQNFGAIGTFTSFEELKSILGKVSQKTSETIDGLITGRGIYRLTDIALAEHPEIEEIQSKGHKTDVGSGALKILSNVIYFKEKPTDGKEYVQVLGLLDNQRVYYWIDRQYLSEPDNFEKYKVILPKANGSGAIGEVLSTPLVGYPLVGFTETFISIGIFDTLDEAEAALKYVKSKFARTMLGILKVTQDNPRDKWVKVPLQDFTPNSDIDWTKSIPEIDQQFYKKYGLDQKEIDFIEEKVREME